MQGVLYIPYINTEMSNDFGYEISSNEYLEQLNNVGNNIVGGNFYNMSPQIKSKQNFQTNNNNNNDVTLDYYEVPCDFLDMMEKHETIDNLLNYYNTKDNFISIFSINEDDETIEDDAMVEFKGWVVESEKVLNMPDNVYSEDIKYKLQPTRDFKIKIGENNAFAMLKECRFVQKIGYKTGILVNEIIFLK